MQIISTKNSSSEEIVKRASEVLAKGGILIFPTETCYGIGVDATNPIAVEKAMKYKARREGKPFSIAVRNREMAEKYVEVNEIAANLYENYLPGPITVVSKSKGAVAEGIESEYGTIGIRIPDYPLVLEILEDFGKPITSTSANPSYMKTPYSITELLETLPEKQKSLIDLVIDAGDLPHNPPSTVVDTTLNNLNIMREGSIEFEKTLSQSNEIMRADTKSAEETANFGSLLMQKFIDTVLETSVIFALKGDLGAGKTQFTKGVAKKLRIDPEEVSSPTYTIIDEHKFEVGEHRKGYLVHMDTWRVDGADELARTGLKEYLAQKGNVIVIEWADKFFNEIQEYIKNGKFEFEPKVVFVELTHVSPEERKIVAYGD